MSAGNVNSAVTAGKQDILSRFRQSTKRYFILISYYRLSSYPISS